MKHLAFAFALFSCVRMAAGQEQETSRENQPTPALKPVTWERLLNASSEPENWLMYSGTLDSQRFSRLDQVDKQNVRKLELKWAYQIPEIDRAETVPIVVDGVMFITESPSNVRCCRREYRPPLLAL